ncbi:MAG: hypothetical protein U0414_10155 [Polyangiaceae bacterium]
MKARISLGALAVAAPLLLSGCSKESDYDAFVAANKEFVGSLQAAASSSPEKVREVFDAQKGALRAKLEKLKGTRSFQARDKTLKEFETNVTSSLDEVCHLDIDAICGDYKSLLSTSD